MTNKPNSLTPKQEKFLKTLASYIKSHKEAPTVAEMMRLNKCSSPRAVTQYLEALERRGVIRRGRYEARGIELIQGDKDQGGEVRLPVIASAGCDNASVLAERTFDDYLCVPRSLMAGRPTDSIVIVKAVGDSMTDAGINNGDRVLVEITESVSPGDLVVAIVDSNAVIKKLEVLNNAIVLHPVSPDPQYRPIILRRDFKIFGKVVDVLRTENQSGDLDVVPLVAS